MLPSEAWIEDDPAERPTRARSNGYPAARALWLAEPPTEADRAAEIRIDRPARRAYVGDDELPLTTQLFDLLAFFMDHRGAAVSFDDLAAAVWSYPRNVGDHHFLHTAVYRLRRILATAGVDDLIDGIRGFGYRIKAAPPPDEVPVTLAPQAVAVFDPTDPDLRLAMANDATVQLTGYNIAALTNLREAATSLWSPEERVAIDAAVRETLNRGSAHALDRKLTRADGTVVRVDIAFSRLDLPGREPLCLAEVNPLP